MKHKVFLSIGNKTLEDKIKSYNSIEIVDGESDLKIVKALIQHLQVEYIIINSLLDEEGDSLLEIAKEARKNDIKVIVIMPGMESIIEKKLVGALANVDVNAFIFINDLTEEKLKNILDNYPKEFNFNMLGKQEVKFIEKEKIVKEEIIKATVLKSNIITCYSPDDNFLSAEVSSQLAIKLSEINQLKTIVNDFNNINPMIDHLLVIDKKLPINDRYGLDSKTSMAALVNAIDRDRLNPDIFKKLVIRHPKYKFDVITGLYDLFLDDHVERHHYEKIIKAASDIYDLVIINTNSYLKAESTFTALTNATKVITISRDNYSSIRNLISQIVLLNKRIDKEKFNIIVSKNIDYGIKEEILKDMFDEYKFLGFINQNTLIDKAINEEKVYLDVIDKSSKENYDKIIIELGYLIGERRTGLLSKIMRKEK